MTETGTPFEAGGRSRRTRLRGLPGARADDGSVFDNLRREFGEENAQAMVTRIGEHVRAQGLENLGISVNDAVSRILSDMTAAERAQLAHGTGMPPRVQALIDDQKRAAENQQRSAGLLGGAAVNAYGSDRKFDGVGALGSTQQRGARALRDYDERSGANVSSISGEYSRAFSGTGYDAATVKTFAEVGLNKGLYDSLRAEGYDKPTIARAARGVKALGFKGKEAIKDGAAIEDKDAGWLEEKAKPFQDQLKAETDPAKREQLEQGFFKNEVLPEPDRAAREAKGRFWERITGKNLDLNQRLEIEQGIDTGHEGARHTTAAQDSEVKRSAGVDRKVIDDAKTKAVNASDTALADAFENSLGSKPATAAPAQKQADAEPAKGPQPAPAGNQKTAEAKPAAKPPAPKV